MKREGSGGSSRKGRASAGELPGWLATKGKKLRMFRGKKAQLHATEVPPTPTAKVTSVSRIAHQRMTCGGQMDPQLVGSSRHGLQPEPSASWFSAGARPKSGWSGPGVGASIPDGQVDVQGGLDMTFRQGDVDLVHPPLGPDPLEMQGGSVGFRHSDPARSARIESVDGAGLGKRIG